LEPAKRSKRPRFREVKEETGLECRIIRELAVTQYNTELEIKDG